MKLVNKYGAVQKSTAKTQIKWRLSINNLGQSLFQTVKVVLNGTSVSSSNNLHTYKAIIEADLPHEPVIKEGTLRKQPYFFWARSITHQWWNGISAFSLQALVGGPKLKNQNSYFPSSDSFLSCVEKEVKTASRWRVPSIILFCCRTLYRAKALAIILFKLSQTIYQFTCWSFVVKASSQSKRPCWRKLHNMTTKTSKPKKFWARKVRLSTKKMMRLARHPLAE